MSMKGKRELPKGSVNEKPNYPMVSRGNNEADRLDTERRLEERRRQRALAEAAETAKAAEATANDEEYEGDEAEEGGAAWVKKTLIVVCVLLAIVLAGLLVYRTIFVKPELENEPAPKPNVEQPGEGEVEIDVGDGLQPMISGERKSEDFYTFLVIGRDTGGGGNCDTMLLASYDMVNQKVTVMSIPRDTMVNVPWDVKKINSVYPRYGGGEKGIEKLKTEISQLVGFKPDYTVVVEWEAVGEMVDAIGGVWFDVPYEMRYWDPYQDLQIVVDKGYQKLDGESAMGVIRWRHNSDGKGYPNGDLGRIETQQAFLKAVVKQLLQVKNAVKLFEFAQIFEKNVTTELSVQNIFWFAKGAVMGGLDMENVEFVTMPNRATSCWSRLVKNMQSYVVPRPTQLLELVNTKLSPFTKVFTLSDLDIMSVNADGSVSSTTGVVADAPAALPPEKPTDKDEEDVIITDPNDPNYDPTKDPNNPLYIPPEEDAEGSVGDGGEGFVDNGEGIGGDVTPPAEEETPPAEETESPGEETVPSGEEPTEGEENPESYDPADGGEGFVDDGTGW